MTQGRFLIRAAFSICAFWWSMADASAQSSTTGEAVGTVTAATGALVPKAEVQLVNTDTNATAVTTTNDAGEYVFPSAIPGPYRITVKMQGFRTANIST